MHLGMKRLFFVSWICLFCHRLAGQSIGLEELQQADQARFFGLYSQNDLYQYHFSADKYFTNGAQVVFAHPVFDTRFAKTILISDKGEYISEYSLAIGQDIFTPEDIMTAAVDSTDRPYSGLLYATYTRNANNIRVGRKIVSKLFVGVQGPISGAETLQHWIHKQTESKPPQGWNNQIANGLMIDYEIKQQKMLPVKSRHIELNTNAVAHAGTIYNFVQAGITGKLGWFNNSYYHFDGLYNKRVRKGTFILDDVRWLRKKRENHPEKARSRTTYINRDFQCYFFTDFNLGYMFYNGAKSGSLIPFADSPYTLNTNELDKDYSHLTQGITLNYHSVFLQYERVIKRDVVKGEGFYGWGQIRLSISI
jgi:lipid A 3-O-deacylase